MKYQRNNVKENGCRIADIGKLSRKIWVFEKIKKIHENRKKLITENKNKCEQDKIEETQV